MNQLVPIKLPHNITLTVKREDLLHPYISGNKFRKLKYNIAEAKKKGYTKLLTFGGAYSNHIAATAAAGKEYNISTVGIIRGEELVDKIDDNPTLSFAKSCGMQFKFISRSDYREKSTPVFIDALHSEFGNFYLLPEGGTNALAVKGCEEILTSHDALFNYICCAVGTGGTIAGLANAALSGQQVLGFPVLKNGELQNDIALRTGKNNWKLISGYEFGGYGKVTAELITFINNFYENTGIPLDPVYTGKLFFGVTDMIHKGLIAKNSAVLVIHTGGLQGIAGMNTMLEKKKMPIIKTLIKC